MITPQEFEKRWIRSPLIRLKAEDVAHLPIPGSSKDFLVQVGLPERPMFDMRCHVLRETFSPVAKIRPSAEYACDTKSCYLLTTAGYQDSIGLCMDVENNGEIVYLIADSDEPKRFANSSVIYLAEFFLAMQELEQKMSLYKSYEEMEKDWKRYTEILAKGNHEDDILRKYLSEIDRYYDCIDAFEATFLQIEPKALEHEENFWPMRLLSMRT